MLLRFEITESPGRLRKLGIESGQAVKVGRSEQADVALPEDTMLSRLHFAVECKDEGCQLRDLGSSNGTYLNRKKIDGATPLKDGDCIQAGRSTFRVRIRAAADASAASSSGQTAALSSSPGLTAGGLSRADARTRSSTRWAPVTPGSGDRLPVLESRPEPSPAAAPAEPAPAAREPVPPPGPARATGEAAARPAGVPEAREMAALQPGQFEIRTMMWEGLDGKARMTIIVKCTCKMPAKQGAPATVAEEQWPIFEADVPWEDESIQSLRFESDLVPFKPRADVVVVGAAYFPRHKDPETPLDVAVRVGRLEKTIRVYGDRSWWFPTRLTLIPEISKPAPFSRMDLVYDRAFGGIDGSAALYSSANLAGRGFAGKKSPDSLHGKPLPNFEDPGEPIRGWDSRPRPAGFGFYGRGWSPRLEMAGTPSSQPEGRERTFGLPADFDYGVFNGAHPDLQVPGYLRGDEEVELRNMPPDADFEFRLPGLRPKVVVTRWETPPDEWLESRFREGQPATIDDVPTREESIEPVLDTLVIVPDDGLCYLVYRGQVPLRDLERPEVANVAVNLEAPRSTREKPPAQRTWIPRADG